MFINPLYLVLLVPAFMAWYAQFRVRASYERWGRVQNRHGLSGIEVAEQLLRHVGLRDVGIAQAPGYLTDHYDTRANALVISEGIAASRSVTAMGIVAHEVLHAVQDHEGYPLMRLRTWLGERLGPLPHVGMWLFLIGLLYNLPVLIGVASVALVAAVVLGILALPVERNASRRALLALQEAGLASQEDLGGARDVLRSAALTYAAGLGQYLGRLAFMGLIIASALGLWQRGR